MFILWILSTNLLACQIENFDKKIVAEETSINVLEAPFMIEEIIEIYKKDSLIVKKAFNPDIFNRTKYTLYCYNVCTDRFIKKLTEKRNNENKVIIDKIVAEVDYDQNLNKPEINWARIYETCQTCPFGSEPWIPDIPSPPLPHFNIF